MNQTLWKKIAFALLVFTGAASAQVGHKLESKTVDFSRGQWVDLSHTLESGMPRYPGMGSFEFTMEFEGDLPSGEYMSLGRISVHEHIGTHVDSPLHFKRGMAGTSDIPLDKLTGFAAVIDVREGAKDRAYQITVADVKRWEAKNRVSVNDRVVIFYTGYSNQWGNHKAYFGTPVQSAEGQSAVVFPSISPDLAKWLIANRKIKSLGLDVSSTDSPHLPTHEKSTHDVHVQMAGAGIPTFENVANLKALEGAWSSAYVVALPVKTRGGTGGPVRIAAFLPSKR